MSMYEDQQLFQIRFTFVDGTKETKTKMGGGYDRDSIDNPLRSIRYSGDIVNYIERLIRAAHMRSSKKITEKLPTVVDVEFAFQALYDNGSYFLTVCRWKENEGIQTVEISCYDNDFVMDAFCSAPDWLYGPGYKLAQKGFDEAKSFNEKNAQVRFSRA